MHKLEIRKSVLDDVFELALRLRPDDVREVLAVGSNPRKSLLLGFIYSDTCYTAVAGNQVLGMYGASNHNLAKGFASIWCLTAPQMEKYPIAFVKEGKRFLDKCLQQYDIVMNRVDSRNTLHIKWLKHIGVTLTNSVLINGVEFIQFYKTRESGK